MKKILLTTLAVTVAGQVVAMDAPTVYGQVSKEFRHVSQKKDFNRDEMTGIQDVQNSETRLGVKGTVDAQEGLTVGYNLELGVRSADAANSTSSAGFLRIRQANASVGGAFGTLTVGQTWTATANAFNGMDPLMGTGVSLLGADQVVDVAGAVSQVGYANRSRVDLVKYQAPTFAGLTYTTSMDRDDSQNDRTTTGRSEQVWENLLSYKLEAGSVKSTINLVYNQASGNTYALRVYDNQMGLGADTMLGDLRLGLAYTMDEKKEASAELNNTYMMGALSYTLGNTVLSATYGAKEVETKTAAATTKDDYTQMALGAAYNFSKNFTAHLTASKYEVEKKSGVIAGSTLMKNDATTVATGLVVKF